MRELFKQRLGCLLPLILLLAVLSGTVYAVAVGTTTVTRDATAGPYRRVNFSWVSHTDGTVSGTVTGIVNGKIVGVITDPGTPAPTDNYDVTLISSDGFDVLNGRGIDRDTANTEQVVPAVASTDGTTAGIAPVVVVSTLELRIANAGSAKAGKLILLLE